MVAAAILDFGKCINSESDGAMRKIWWADASRPCGDDTWPKLETGSFYCVTSLLWWIKVYILNECLKHNRSGDVKAYKSSQLTNLKFKPMQNSFFRAIV